MAAPVLSAAQIDAMSPAELDEALALLESRPKFTIAEFAGKHEPQYKFLADRSHRKHVMCARQAGKSQGCDALMLDRALGRPNSTWLMLGLNGPQIRTNNWEPIWTRLFSRFGGLSGVRHNDTRMVSTFPNGSRVIFGGTDDAKHIKNLLGGRLDGGGIIIDECQDQGHVLDELLDSILPPMMSLTSELVLAGVFPDAPAGRFWRESGWIQVDGRFVQRTDGGWSRHNWGRLANVHTPEAREVLRRYMADTGLNEDDPQIMRDWGGRPAFDPTATAYRYAVERNGYVADIPEWLVKLYETQKDAKGRDLLFCHPMRDGKKDGARHGLMAATPRPGVRIVGFAIDPGSTSDRVSIQGWGWGDKDSHDVQHLFDWTTPRAAQLTTGQIFAMAGVAQSMFSQRGLYVMKWRYDAGSSQNTIDNLQNDYGLPVILAAKKADLKGQVDRNNDLLTGGRAKIMIGSALEQDYQRARWDKQARERGQYKWASAWHPDPSEAGRYGLQDYFDAFEKPETPTVFDDPLLKRIMAANMSGDDKPNYG